MRFQLKTRDPELHHHDQLTTTNRLLSQPWMKPFRSIFPMEAYEISHRRGIIFQQRMTVPQPQPLQHQFQYWKCRNEAPWDTFTNLEVYKGQLHLEMNQLVDSENHDKCTKSSDGNHPYRWINKRNWRRARQRTPQSKTIISLTIRQTTSIPANAPERYDKSNEPDSCRTCVIYIPKHSKRDFKWT